jgi:pullulanase
MADDTPASAPLNTRERRAFWLAPSLIVIPEDLCEENVTFSLVFKAEGGLTVGPGGVENADASYELKPDDQAFDDQTKERFPHLAGYKALTAAIDEKTIEEIIQGQLALSLSSGKATGLQLPALLDSLFFYEDDLGLVYSPETITFKLWAPTAKNVQVNLYSDAAALKPFETLDMQRSGKIWQAETQGKHLGCYYTYTTTVYAPWTNKIETYETSDPYSFDVAVNGAHSRIVDINAAEHKPEGWDTLEKPPLASWNDLSIYELHIRDFSAHDPTVSEESRGGFLAFTESEGSGVKHLKELAEAGIKAVHLLPAFDFASVNEDKKQWKNYPIAQKDDDPAAAKYQQELSQIIDEDGFNWGYDPFHYFCPEGSYASDPDRRIFEMRRMIQALNSEIKLRVIMDVVFNHTAESESGEKSIFDKIVPYYYYRYNLDGYLDNSSAANDTATEHAMMEKLMTDALYHWARHYKIDGFRFDLMGHHLVRNMEAIRRKLDTLSKEEHGIDGRALYLYGEGWDFGGLAYNARGKNASMGNLYGTGIGSFNDKFRDAIRGGGNGKEQGFASGLGSDFRREPKSTDIVLSLRGDLIKIGLAGSLRDYKFTDHLGNQITAGEFYHNDMPVGYTAAPTEQISYISAHDNQTLFDAILFKSTLFDINMQVRMNRLALSFVLLSQGIPFLHAGDEILRSKSFDADSYNSGDRFNYLDYSYNSNNFSAGLPLEEKNKDRWPQIQPLLSNQAFYSPNRFQIEQNFAIVKDFIKIRYSSPLFRMASPEEINSKLMFLTGTPPGVIAMLLNQEILVVFNANFGIRALNNTEAVDPAWQLHPIQAAGSDPLVKTFKIEKNYLRIPALSTLVLTKKAN